jgi:hypothetical protein
MAVQGFPAGAGAKGTRTLMAQSREFHAAVTPVVMELQRQGLSLRGIARELEKRGVLPRQEWDYIVAVCDRRGMKRPSDFRTRGWSANQVLRVIQRSALVSQGLSR